MLHNQLASLLATVATDTVHMYIANSCLNYSAVEIITPSDPNQRGAQLCLKFSSNYSVEEVNEKLIQQGVVVSCQNTYMLKYSYMHVILQCSARKTNILRVAPAPMYNSFIDVLTFYNILEKILASDNAG